VGNELGYLTNRTAVLSEKKRGVFRSHQQREEERGRRMKPGERRREESKFFHSTKKNGKPLEVPAKGEEGISPISEKKGMRTHPRSGRTRREEGKEEGDDVSPRKEGRGKGLT